MDRHPNTESYTNIMVKPSLNRGYLTNRTLNNTRLEWNNYLEDNRNNLLNENNELLNSIVNILQQNNNSNREWSGNINDYIRQSNINFTNIRNMLNFNNNNINNLADRLLQSQLERTTNLLEIIEHGRNMLITEQTQHIAIVTSYINSLQSNSFIFLTISIAGIIYLIFKQNSNSNTIKILTNTVENLRNIIINSVLKQPETDINRNKIELWKNITIGISSLTTGILLTFLKFKK